MTTEAEKLYNFLKVTGGAWENKCMEALFPAPKYPTETEGKAEKQRIYWQYQANMYGIAENERPVGEGRESFTPQDNYSKKLSAAYQELRKAGKAGERNSGYNDYYFFPL